MATYSHNLAGAAKKSTKTTCSETLATRISTPAETGIELEREGRSCHIFGVARQKERARERERELPGPSAASFRKVICRDSAQWEKAKIFWK